MNKALIFFGIIAALGTLAHAQVRDVLVGTNGVVVAPANFWNTNKADIVSAITGTNAAGLLGLQTNGIVVWPTNVSYPKFYGALYLQNPTIAGAPAYPEIAANNAMVGTYACIDIPLGGPYTDFELKASVDNFTDDAANMVFFYHSPDPSKSVIPQVWTTRPDVFFTDSQYVGSPASRNQRHWRKQTPTQSIAAMRANSNSVIASVTIVVRDVGWYDPITNKINRSNPKLVWSYCRMTPTGYETDPGGKSIWHTVTPKWIPQPINP